MRLVRRQLQNPASPSASVDMGQESNNSVLQSDKSKSNCLMAIALASTAAIAIAAMVATLRRNDSVESSGSMRLNRTPEWQKKFVVDSLDAVEIHCVHEEGSFFKIGVDDESQRCVDGYSNLFTGDCLHLKGNCTFVDVVEDSMVLCDPNNAEIRSCMDDGTINTTYYRQGGFVGQSCKDYSRLNYYFENGAFPRDSTCVSG